MEDGSRGHDRPGSTTLSQSQAPAPILAPAPTTAGPPNSTPAASSAVGWTNTAGPSADAGERRPGRPVDSRGILPFTASRLAATREAGVPMSRQYPARWWPVTRRPSVSRTGARSRA